MDKNDSKKPFSGPNTPTFAPAASAAGVLAAATAVAPSSTVTGSEASKSESTESEKGAKKSSQDAPVKSSYHSRSESSNEK